MPKRGVEGIEMMVSSTLRLKIGLMILGAGLFLKIVMDKSGHAVPPAEDWQVVTFSAGAQDTLSITKSLLASKDIKPLAQGAQISLGAYNATQLGDFTAGSDFTADNGSRLKNFFNGAKDFACLALSMGTEWQQSGQTGRDNKVTFLGSPGGAPSPNIFVDLVQPGGFFNSTLTTPLPSVTTSDFGSCNSPSLGSVSGAGLALTNTSPGNTAENPTRNFKGEIGYLVPNLHTAGLRDHSFQVRVEAVTGI